MLTGDEYFNIYSCSKITTVTAGMQLLERGKFLLTDPLWEYIPEYKTMYIKSLDGSIAKAKNAITIGDLFSMSAGFTYNFKANGILKARELTGGKMDTVTVVKCMAEDPIAFEPGTHWRYSLCHDVLAALANYGKGLTGECILSKYAINLMRTNRLSGEQFKDYNMPALAGYGYGLGVRTHLDRAVSGSLSNIGEFGWCGAAGSAAIIDPEINLAVFFAQHMLRPHEEYYMPRLRNIVYSCLG